MKHGHGTFGWVTVAALCLAVQVALPQKAVGESNHDFVLMITGTDGLAFSGSCSLKTAEGKVDLPLDGRVPEHHEVRGTGLRCVIEKSGREGTLTVEVMRDGQIVSYNSSNGSAGVFNVSVR